MLAFGVLLLSITVAVNLLLEDSPVVIQLEGDTFKVLDIPYVYTVKEAYILLFSGFFGGLASSLVLYSLGVFHLGLPLSEQTAVLNETVNEATTVNLTAGACFGENLEISSESAESTRNNSEFPGNNSEFSENNSEFPGNNSEFTGSNIDPIEVLLRALEGDERKTIELITAKGGRILQNELVNSLDFSKAKVSRVLMNLERRGIITKKKYGLTNCISISEELKTCKETTREMK